MTYHLLSMRFRYVTETYTSVMNVFSVIKYQIHKELVEPKSKSDLVWT